MRYHQVVNNFSVPDSDRLLVEGLLDGIARFIGNRINDKVKVVTNTGQALLVIYKVCTSSAYSESATFLLKKTLKASMKSMPDSPLKRAVQQRWPAGREPKDFVKALILFCVVSARLQAGKLIAGQAADKAGDVAKDATVELAKKLMNVDTLVAAAIAAPTGIFTVLKALEVADLVLFQALTLIAKKLATAQVRTQ